MRRLRRTILLLIGFALTTPVVLAQVPSRPRLPIGTDINDWEPYYDLGVTSLRDDPRTAQSAFFWATRLDPTRAEPPFAQWVAFWVAQDERAFRSYMDGDTRTLRRPDVAHFDSLRALAFTRNPFVHQGLYLVVIDMLPGSFRQDVATQGWIAYANADLARAIERFGVALRREPERLSYLHYLRSSALVGLGAFDSAATELDTYIGQMRARDVKRPVFLYDSKARLEYARGLLYDQLRRPAAADEALGRALAEDMSFAPAHSALGRRALSRGRVGNAIDELKLALELDSTDIVTRLALGDALMRQGNAAGAAEQYRRVVAAEPYYAEGVYRYSVALDSLGRGSDAAMSYSRALELGARQWANGPLSRARLAALRSGG